MKYDVVVVGAGTGGCAAAAAIAKQGLKVCCVERKPREKIGDKVCGDATSFHHFKLGKKLYGIDPPRGEEILQEIAGVLVYSPDRDVELRIENPEERGCIIDRKLFGQRLLNLSEDNGAEILTETRVMEPIWDKKQISGVTARKRGGEEIQEIRGSIVIDASGINGQLRRLVDSQLAFWDQTIEGHDIVYAYREIRDLTHEFEDPEYIKIFLDQELAPGGYYWEFPRGDGSMNAGLGVEASGNFPSPKDLYLSHIKNNPLYKNSKVIHAGGARVPLRRPMDSFVYNGLMLVGDAGSQVKPTDGGGIGHSVKGATYAATVIGEAFENEDFSTESLWKYNVHFMREIAAVNGPLCILKSFVTKLDNNEINELLRKKIITADDILQANKDGSMPMGLTEKAKRLLRGRKLLGLLKELRTVTKKMRQIKDIYENYPEDISSFLEWRKELLSVL